MSLRIEHPPRTIMELYKSLPEGTLAELIDSKIIMSPSPTSRHQKILNKINVQLFNCIEDKGLGEVYTAPMDVYLDENSNAVQPDIIVVLNDGQAQVKPNGHIHGSPDMLIEILSPGNKDHDLITKKALYERFGVQEYWIVDPHDKSVVGYTLQGNSYSSISGNTGSISAQLLDVEITF